MNAECVVLKRGRYWGLWVGDQKIAAYSSAEEAEQAAQARNGVAVMSCRGWSPVRGSDGLWRVPHPVYPDLAMATAPDPMASLILAEAWYKQNVERKPEDQ